MTFPTRVKLVEVSPRDGLQNEKQLIPTSIKVELIQRLAQAGLKVIEATSFVSPKWIPQLADHQAVYESIDKQADIRYPVLVPNLKGFERAMQSNVREIAVFTTPSESFAKHNINSTVEESLQQIAQVIAQAKQHQISVRAYLSCVLGCPYEGEMAPSRVAEMAKKLYDMGCYEISLGDTIGVGTPLKTKTLLETVLRDIPVKALAVHFHDTFACALANIYVALELGISVIDCSVAGLGGCPYAEGASGNVATEDVLYMLNGMGIETGVDLNLLVQAGQFISNYLGKPARSKVSLAIQRKSNES